MIDKPGLESKCQTVKSRGAFRKTTEKENNNKDSFLKQVEKCIFKNKDDHLVSGPR